MRECTCKCPDGPEQHLEGCHVYDSAEMAMLRTEWIRRFDGNVRRLLNKLAAGEVAPANYDVFVRNLEKHILDVCSLAAKMAMAAQRFSGGTHDSRPWE